MDILGLSIVSSLNHSQCGSDGVAWGMGVDDSIERGTGRGASTGNHDSLDDAVESSDIDVLTDQAFRSFRDRGPTSSGEISLALLPLSNEFCTTRALPTSPSPSGEAV